MNYYLLTKGTYRRANYLLSLMLLLFSATAMAQTAPSITNQPANNIACQGAIGVKFSVTAANANSYQWQVDNNGGGGFVNIINGGVYTFANSMSLVLNNVTASMNGYHFRCVATGPGGSTASNSVTLTVNTPIVITGESSTNTTICNGVNTSFFVNTTGTVTGYQWYGNAGAGYVPISNGGYYSGATTATLSLTNVQTAPEAYISYYCQVSGPCGSKKTGTKYLTVNAKPVVTASPQNTIICSGANATFKVSATGTGLTYQWQLSTNGGGNWSNVPNAAPYSGVTGSQLLLTEPAINLSGNVYRCIVSGVCSPSATSGNATLTVNTKPAITSQPVDVTTCLGSNVFFKVKATGSNLTYQWQGRSGNNWVNLSNNPPLSGVNTDSLRLTNVQNGNGVYRCVVTGSCPAPIVSEYVQLTVNRAPSISDNPTPVTTCIGTTTSFSVTANGSNLTYQWQVSNGSGWSAVANNSTYSGATTDKLTIANVQSSLGNNEYRCVVSGSCPSPVTSSPAALLVPPTVTPSVSIVSNYNNVCYGLPITFTATPVNPGPTPTYIWKVNNVVMYTGPSYIYISSTLNNNDIVHCDMVTSALCPTVQQVSSNGVAMIVTNYEQPTIDVVEASGAAIICSGVPVTFNTNTTFAGPNPSFQWQVNGMNVGFNTASYTTDSLDDNDVVRCILTSSFLCPATTYVTSNGLPVDLFQSTPATVSISKAKDTTICRGTEVKLTAYYTNSGISPQFQWLNKGKIIVGETGPTYTSALLKDNDAIQCRFISSATCVFPVNSDTLKFNVEAPVLASVSLSVHYAGDNKYTFIAIPVNGGANPTYEWYVNNVKMPGQTKQMYTAPIKSTDRVHVVMLTDHFCAVPGEVKSRFITTGLDNENINLGALSLYPNPNNGKFIVTGEFNTTGNQKAVISVINTVGQVIYTQEANVNAGKLNHEINMNTPAAGMYMLRMELDGKQETRRFNIQ